MDPHWTHFEHEADIGISGCGPTVAIAFEQAALALTAIVTDPDKVVGRETLNIECKAPDIELLLVDWLNAVIFEMVTRKWLFCRYEVSIVDTGLKATLWGEAVGMERHTPAVEPKGATFTMLKVARQNDGWYAGCVVDV